MIVGRVVQGSDTHSGPVCGADTHHPAVEERVARETTGGAQHKSPTCPSCTNNDHFFLGCPTRGGGAVGGCCSGWGGRGRRRRCTPYQACCSALSLDLRGKLCIGAAMTDRGSRARTRCQVERTWLVNATDHSCNDLYYCNSIFASKRVQRAMFLLCCCAVCNCLFHNHNVLHKYTTQEY